MRRSFSLSRSVSCDLARLWQCLEQPELFLARIPPLKQATALAREADVSILEIEYEGAKNPLALEIVVAGDSTLSFYQVDRLRGQGVEGEVALESGPGGGTSLSLNLHLPLGLIGFTRASAVASCLDTAVEVVESTMKTRPIRVPSGVPTKLLEIRREGGVVKVWIKGKTYVLPGGHGE
ncbi:MAG: hypothetical protein GY906_36625 [bacterium]|nr:hypothetical protein [bacterium]